MKIRLTFLASTFLLVTSSTAGGQTAEQALPLTDSANALRAPEFKPGLDDLMTMLIQPRHIRLYYAGTGDNWELAAFELAELRSAFRRVVEAMPRYQGSDVTAALRTFIDPNIQAIDATIKAGNSRQFVKEYARLTGACNACHTFLEHPFLVIKVPDTAAFTTYADQNLGK